MKLVFLVPMQPENELPVILVAEDDHDDQELIMECLEKIKSPVKVEIVGNGKLALERLQNARLPPPCLVVLDINMPYLNGIETLQRIRTEPTLKDIPVVMFTTADNEESRLKALSLGANDYFVKAGDFGEWLSHAGKMVQYCA